MKIVEEEITLGFTQALGNYEFLRADVKLRALLDDDDLDDVHDKLYAKVEAKLVESAKDVHAGLSKEAKRKTRIDPS
jgi:hypothetical protein